MTNFTSLLRQCLLAIALAGAAFGAAAGPTSFHVTLNTATIGPDARFIDFFFSHAFGAPAITATVSKLTGAFGPVTDQGGNATANIGGTLTIGNGPGDINFIDFTPTFGGAFGFDVSFDTGFLSAASTAGSFFSLSVLDMNLAPVGGDFGLAMFDLDSVNGIVLSTVGRFATIVAIDAVTAVPEPTSVLVMLTGLGLVGFARRRKGAAAA